MKNEKKNFERKGGILKLKKKRNEGMKEYEKMRQKEKDKKKTRRIKDMMQTRERRTVNKIN